MDMTTTDTSTPLAPVLPIPGSALTVTPAMTAAREILNLTVTATALTGAHGVGTLTDFTRDVLDALAPAEVTEVALALVSELRDQIIIANTARLETTPF